MVFSIRVTDIEKESTTSRRELFRCGVAFVLGAPEVAAGREVRGPLPCRCSSRMYSARRRMMRWGISILSPSRLSDLRTSSAVSSGHRS